LLATLCLAYAIGVLVYWLLIRYLGDRWWPATVLLFAPRWPVLLPLLVFLPLSRRLKKLFWLPLLTTLFIFSQLMGLAIPWRRVLAQNPPGQAVRVLFCNVHGEELNSSAFDEYLQASKPQVVLLQDYSAHDATKALKDPRWHRQQIGQIFIASAYPIRHVHDFHLGRVTAPDDNIAQHRTGAAVCFDLETPAGLVHVVNLHLASPHSGLRDLFRNAMSHGASRLKSNSVRRWNESQQINDWLATQTGPLIIAGDFNTPAESPIFRHFWSKYSDAFTRAGLGLGFTHLSPLSELRIDHLVSGTGVTCVNYLVGPPCGTPHRPIVADLVIRPSP
jgi:endonuclease/exonuclease/phosphatase (EEP) superfamily protein YafD